jgi:hypothetical protein
MKLCITDKDSIPFNATNSTELLEEIKKQINFKVERENNLGLLNESKGHIMDLHRVAFRYTNPQIMNNQLYVDIETMNTPLGILLNAYIKDIAENGLDYIMKGKIVGIGILKEDKSIKDYILSYVYIVLEADQNT